MKKLALIFASSEPTYKYVKGQGWIPSYKRENPKTHTEMCEETCPRCNIRWGSHSGWDCPKGGEWPVEDRW